MCVQDGELPAMSSSKTTIYEIGGKGYLPQEGNFWIEIPKMGDANEEMMLVGNEIWMTNRMDSEYDAHKDKYSGIKAEDLYFNTQIYYDEVFGLSCSSRNSYVATGYTHPNLNPTDWQLEINDLVLSGVTGTGSIPTNYPNKLFINKTPRPKRNKDMSYTAKLAWMGV